MKQETADLVLSYSWRVAWPLFVLCLIFLIILKIMVESGESGTLLFYIVAGICICSLFISSLSFATAYLFYVISHRIYDKKTEKILEQISKDFGDIRNEFFEEAAKVIKDQEKIDSQKKIED